MQIQTITLTVLALIAVVQSDIFTLTRPEYDFNRTLDHVVISRSNGHVCIKQTTNENLTSACSYGCANCFSACQYYYNYRYMCCDGGSCCCYAQPGMCAQPGVTCVYNDC